MSDPLKYEDTDTEILENELDNARLDISILNCSDNQAMRESTMSNMSRIEKDNCKSESDDDYFSRTEYGSLMSKCSSMNDFRSIVSDLEMLKNLSPTQDSNQLTMDSFKESFMGNDDDFLTFKNINYDSEDCFSIDSAIDRIDERTFDKDTLDLDRLNINMPDQLDKINLKDFTRSKLNQDYRKCINVILGYDNLNIGFNEKKSDPKRCNNIQCSNCDKLVKIYDNYSLDKDIKRQQIKNLQQNLSTIDQLHKTPKTSLYMCQCQAINISYTSQASEKQDFWKCKGHYKNV